MPAGTLLPQCRGSRCDNVVTTPHHAIGNDCLLFSRAVDRAADTTIGCSPRCHVRDIIAAQANRSAEQRTEHRTSHCAARRVSCGGPLVGKMLAIGDVILIVAATDTRIYQWPILLGRAASKKTSSNDDTHETRCHGAFPLDTWNLLQFG